MKPNAPFKKHFVILILLWCVNCHLLAESGISAVSYVSLNNSPDLKNSLDKKQSIIVLKIQESGSVDIFTVIKGSTAKPDIAGQKIYNSYKAAFRRAGDLYCLYLVEIGDHDSQGMLKEVKIETQILFLSWEQPPEKIPLDIFPKEKSIVNSNNDPIKYLKIKELIEHYRNK